MSVLKNVRSFFLLMAALLPACGSGAYAQVHTATLTNPLSVERKDECMVWDRAELEKQTGAIPEGKFIHIYHGNHVPVAVQLDDMDGDHRWDEAVFVLSFAPHEKIDLEVSIADAPVGVKIPVRAHVRMREKNEDDTFGPLVDSAVMPVRNPPTDFSVHKLPHWLTEGPGWENDKVAYRLYFDTRNGKDIYGKTRSAMVMDEVGADPSRSYHELADWGMDILKVGGSLGAGALALLTPIEGKRDTLIRLGGQHVTKESFRVISDGPLRAVFRMDYEWTVNDQPVSITEEITISGGQYYYESKVTVRGAPAGSRLVTGIANFNNNEPGHFSEGHAELLYSHGVQSENKDNLGMAILVSKEHSPILGSRPATGSEVTSTYTVSQRIEKDKSLSFRFYTGWEKTDPGFKSAAYFKEMLKKEAEKFSRPVEVKW